MSLVALDGTPLVPVGVPLVPGGASFTTSAVTIAAVNAAAVLIGQIITEDGASHTIDTTGSSSLGWCQFNSPTFASGSTTVKVGLAAVDTANGPPGRAVNAAGVVTFDVSGSIIGGSGGIVSGWNSKVPDTGSKTIASGDLVALAVQMTARGGTDSIAVNSYSSGGTIGLPGVTNFNGSTYSTASTVPNAVITFSDGKLGFFFGGLVFTTMNTQAFNSGSSPKEYGNLITLPFPAKIYGILEGTNNNGDADYVLYSDPLGTPVAERTVSVDHNIVGSASNQGWSPLLFTTPYQAASGQPLGVIAKPTSVTNLTIRIYNLALAGFQKGMPGSGYAINRASGAFAQQNSGKDRNAIGLLVGAFEHGVPPSYQAGIM